MGKFPARRDILHATTAIGITALAGCSDVTGESASADPESGEESDACEPSYVPAGKLSPPESIDEWIADANGYDGERTRTGTRGHAVVELGHEYEDGIGFAPVVVEVPPLTEVRWNWTGHGDAHNVVALDGTFDSGRPNAQAGTSYRYLFEETGTYPFVSEPGRADGTKGVVVVKKPPSTGYEAVDEWVVHSDNFDGTVADATGADTATVTVGAPGNGGNLAFDPPVLKVSAETTVRWEWSDSAPPATVTFEEIDVDSGSPAADPETMFEHTFGASGTFLYSSLPHKSIGMRGAIVVE